MFNLNGVTTRETDLLDALLGQAPIGMGDLILIEVLQGFTSNAEYKSAKNAMETLSFFYFGGKELALKSAENTKKRDHSSQNHRCNDCYFLHRSEFSIITL